MKKQPARKRLFKQAKKPLPDYATFQQLLSLHADNTRGPLLSHFSNDAVKFVLFIFHGNTKLLNENNYNHLIDNADNLTAQTILQLITNELSIRDQYIMQSITGFKLPLQSVREIAENLNMSTKSVYKHIQKASQQLCSSFAATEFDIVGITNDNTDSKLSNKAAAERWVTSSIENEPKRRECVKYIVKRCKLDWILPTSGNELHWLPYYVKVGEMFSVMPIKSAIGARAALLGYTPAYAEQIRIHYGIDAKYTDPPKSLKHCVKTFVKYLNNDKEKFQMFDN